MWLLRQLDAKGWTQAELARRAGVTDATLSRLVSGTRQAGPDAAIGIARALGVSPEKVFREAGLLPQVSEARLQEFYEVAEQLAALPDGPIREEAMAAIRAIAASARERALAAEEREREGEGR